MIYFLITLIFMLLLTLVLPITRFIAAFIVKTEALLYYGLPDIAIIVVLGFALMCVYGYVVIKAKYPRKPSSRLGLYIPLVLPFIWYLLMIVTFNTPYFSDDFKTDLGAMVVAIFGAHTYGDVFSTLLWDALDILFPLNFRYFLLIVNLSYDIILILGFSIGERLAAKKIGMELKPIIRNRKRENC